MYTPVLCVQTKVNADVVLNSLVDVHVSVAQLLCLVPRTLTTTAAVILTCAIMKNFLM